MTSSPLDRLIDLVTGYGVDRDQVATVADYLADRCAGASLATLHSSATVSLRQDAFLVEHLGLSRQQISAWLALLRGTRAVRRRDGGIVGGRPGFIEIAVHSDSAESVERFRRLAARAAGAGCTQRALRTAC